METLPRPTPSSDRRAWGEGGAIGPAAAVANAVNDALHKLGVEICEIPITPRRILEAIAKARRAS
jgi:carbon-monoxide dehydrogenase large subunit